MSTRPPSILLVEDEAIIAASEACVLRKRGFEVTIVTSAAKTLREVAGPAPIDLVLMDVDLSDGTDGTILAEEVLALRDVPIIFLSSHSEPDLIQRASKITPYGYVMKISAEEELVEALDRATQARREHGARKEHDWLLQTTEERHRFAVGGLSDFVYSCVKKNGNAPDAHWTVGSIEKITGYPSTEVVSRGGWHFVVHPEDLPSFKKNVLGLVPGQSTVCELRLVTRDRDLRLVKAYTQCIVDPETPGANRIIGGCREITPLMRTPSSQQEFQHSRY